MPRAFVQKVGATLEAAPSAMNPLRLEEILLGTTVI